VKAGSTRTDLDHLRIGPRLREIRKERGLTLADVAHGTGLTKGFISLLERNETAPSVPTLLRICEYLGVRVGSLFDDEVSRSVIRRSDRGEDIFGGFGITDVLLTPPDQRFLQVIESEIEPGGKSGDEPHSFNADAEVIFIVRGMLDVTFGTEHFRLRRGDALTVAPREPHAWINPSKKQTARVLWIITPRSL
jgi:transcriptional regulator with XRE-family HTH domain